MKISRRKFIGTGLATSAAAMVAPGYARAAVKQNDIAFDPWIEVNREALAFNAKQLWELGGRKPIMAVAKNNAYGLGIETAGPILDSLSEVAGLAVVKTDECFRLKRAGVKKPILLLALAGDKDEEELIRNGVELSVFSDGALTRLESISKKLQKPVPIHCYIDTGMSRVGLRYTHATPWITSAAVSKYVKIMSTFTDLTEDPDFDHEQVNRLKTIVSECTKKGIAMGKVHACSSHGVYHLPEGCIDMIRPGISLYGTYPDQADKESKMKELKCAFRLQARVVRVEQLQTGDSVSYARKFIADKPTWTATIPVGHSDGYPRTAVKGAKILIGRKLYPAIGAVSASHTIVLLGDEKTVNVGDVTTLLGPDDKSIQPNQLGADAGVSPYDLLMHLNSSIPKVIV